VQVWKGEELRGDSGPEDGGLPAVRLRGVLRSASLRAGILQDGQRTYRWAYSDETHRLNMELDFPKFILAPVYSCTYWLTRNSPPSPVFGLLCTAVLIG
jgi:hypothetical protein